MTQEEIEEINKACPSDQGIFREPNHIPYEIKEPVVYMRWETGGMRGGSYHENSCLRPYTSDEGRPVFQVLDIVLKKLRPQITHLEYKEIEEKLIRDYEDSDPDDYYGNRTDYEVNYILLSELEAHLAKLP